jgi:putative ABC transport system ATP-binding protein
MANMIELINVQKTVNTVSGPLQILADIHLQVSSHETLAIVGESGSGKSTLLCIMAGLEQPSSGECWFMGDNIGKLSEDARAERRLGRVGFVFQSFYLLPELNALENVMLPLELADQNEAKERAVAALNRVELGQRLNHLPRQLSGGEQQRVALARAFVTNPAVLFADEPTGNLDDGTSHKVIDLMFELHDAQKTTLVMVTHNVALAQRCQRMVTLQAGRLVA